MNGSSFYQTLTTTLEMLTTTSEMLNTTADMLSTESSTPDSSNTDRPDFVLILAWLLAFICMVCGVLSVLYILRKHSKNNTSGCRYRKAESGKLASLFFKGIPQKVSHLMAVSSSPIVGGGNTKETCAEKPDLLMPGDGSRQQQQPWHQGSCWMPMLQENDASSRRG